MHLVVQTLSIHSGIMHHFSHHLSLFHFDSLLLCISIFQVFCVSFIYFYSRRCALFYRSQTMWQFESGTNKGQSYCSEAENSIHKAFWTWMWSEFRYFICELSKYRNLDENFPHHKCCRTIDSEPEKSLQNSGSTYTARIKHKPILLGSRQVDQHY